MCVRLPATRTTGHRVRDKSKRLNEKAMLDLVALAGIIAESPKRKAKIPLNVLDVDRVSRVICRVVGHSAIFGEGLTVMVSVSTDYGCARCHQPWSCKCVAIFGVCAFVCCTASLRMRSALSMAKLCSFGVRMGRCGRDGGIDCHKMNCELS